MKLGHVALAAIGLALVPVAPATSQIPPPAAQEAPSTRSELALAEGWRFKQDDTLLGAEAPAFDDGGWETVRVPHTWNRVGFYLPNPETHMHRADTVNKNQGVGWYRLAFTPPASMRGKRAWLQFDAASRTAKVWLNGTYLGEHKGGFSRFRFDASKTLRPGARNVLAVRTDSTKPAPGSSTADVLPLAGDFFVHGGLYRPVSLLATDPVHIDMLDYGGPGIYATTRSIAGTQATVDVRTRVRNDGSRPVRLAVVARLIDADGKVAAERSQPLALAAGAGEDVVQTLDLANARLWQGLDDPYLYQVAVELRSIEGVALDRAAHAFGVRQMRFDPQRGFFLNGKPYRLRGVGLHQDREGKGWAIEASDIAADFEILREMGANSIRLTHYQHGQPIHDLADRFGFVLWDEIPLVSVWTSGAAKEATPELRANARQQLQELIRQNSNHPSVATWGIANEVDFGNSFPGFLTTGKSAPDPLPLLQELNALAKREDPGRPTALATCCEGRLFEAGVEVPITAVAADLGGANRYFGWYFGKADDLGPHLDALHAMRPHQPLSVTEYGAGGATTIHTDDVLGGPPDSRGRAQPEEYESYIHEKNWATLAATPYLWGTWLWNSFDFATTIRREGDADDINTKGLVTYDRRIRKDAYYFYKANWTATPTVHVTGRRYTERAYRVTDVRVYSNAATTELVVNGKSQGALTDCPGKICLWKAVRLAPGENLVAASGRFGNTPVEDRVTWNLSPDAAQAFRIDSGALVAGHAAGKRFGSDAFFEGGVSGTTTKPADYGVAAVKAPIAGTADPELAATFRRGDFSYRLPLDNGAYDVTLTFVEPSAGPGERVFDVLANGKRVLGDLDIASTGRMTAVQKHFPVQVRDGRLELRFRPSKGEAIVSAIEVSRPNGR